MAKALDDAVEPTDTGSVGADLSPASRDDPEVAGLLADLVARRRRLVALLGIPSLACYVAYLALSAWGHEVLRTGLGGLTIGWLIFGFMLVLAPVVCAVYSRRSAAELDPLRARLAAIVHGPGAASRGGSR